MTLKYYVVEYLNMIPTIIIFILTISLMILSILFFPKIKIGKINIPTYIVITLSGALILLITQLADPIELLNSLMSNTPVNPLKILALFISMTMLSIFLDELGFFSFLANWTLKKAHTSQTKLFIYLYVIVSILTIFTSNDVIILSFTPFICYFSKRAKINPLPYLISEFVAANTWSMFFIMGNPTNIYLASSFNISFLDYFLKMSLPTLIGGIISFIILYLVFRKELKKEIVGEAEEISISNNYLMITGLIHLLICVVLFAISSYINIEMYLVSVVTLASLIIFTLIYSLIKKTKPKELGKTISRAPWALIPFVLSMFTMIVALNENKITINIANVLGNEMPILKYGLSSFLASNVINNIPMSVLYYSVIENADISIKMEAIYASIIGSNIGAFLTPIGALAGIMWSDILSKHEVKFSYLDFIKYGSIISIPAILASLGILSLVL